MTTDKAVVYKYGVYQKPVRLKIRSNNYCNSVLKVNKYMFVIVANV